MRREATQQEVRCVVERVSCFNRDKVPFYLEVYNTEIEARGIDGTLRLDFFCGVVTVGIHAEVNEL